MNMNEIVFYVLIYLIYGVVFDISTLVVKPETWDDYDAMPLLQGLRIEAITVIAWPYWLLAGIYWQLRTILENI